MSIDLGVDSPLAVDRDNQVIFVAHRNAAGGCELVRFNTHDGSRGPVLHSNERYDFAEAEVNLSGENEVVGLVYPQQATQQLWLRDADERLQREIDSTLPRDHINLILSRSRDDRRLIVHSSSDRHPGTMFLFDRDRHSLTRMGELAPWLPQQLMAPVQLVTYQTRDGVSLEGYVTLPLNHDPAKPGPMVVLPHGGPWIRDCWGYDAESQFLASRGYIVFRPNYRGSSGYRPEISIEPAMDFRTMHDDVTDGVRALIASRIADPHRIGIFGSSFGGYLAIAGAAFEPDLYRCAASFAGVFDIETMMKDDRANKNDYRLARFREDFGDAKENQELFDAMSPLRHAKKIKAAIFVAHGKEDRNADTDQSRRLVRALKSAGIKPETMFISGEAHGLATMKNRVEFFRRLEAFLKKHL